MVNKLGDAKGFGNRHSFIRTTVRNKRHFWKAPAMSGPMKIGFALISVVSIALVYVPATKKLLSFSSFPLELLGITVLMTVIYFLVVDVVKVWFYRATAAKGIH